MVSIFVYRHHGMFGMQRNSRRTGAKPSSYQYSKRRTSWTVTIIVELACYAIVVNFFCQYCYSGSEEGQTKFLQRNRLASDMVEARLIKYSHYVKSQKSTWNTTGSCMFVMWTLGKPLTVYGDAGCGQ
jgi:hypothetical protein